MEAAYSVTVSAPVVEVGAHPDHPILATGTGTSIQICRVCALESGDLMGRVRRTHRYA